MCRTFRVNPRLMVRAFPVDILVFQAQYFGLGMFSNDVEHTDQWEQGAFDWNLHLANAWVKELARILHSYVGSDQPNISGALAFLNLALPLHVWRGCLLTCVGKAIGERVLETVKPGKKVTVRLGGKDVEQGPQEWTVDQFQRHILQRIKKHSRRVENVLLAQESVVETGITSAMSDIWAALPRDPVD
ncbi:unnamed protein product [Rhizoctonia solani]|uniref:Uncharacterized protein n=1 Tax=Rhizoctonia solani TaxID=456999 RepID=A0A8H3GJ63_9AGAM|nr:unnamed protein product [Rhizoctonia solani]